MPPTPPRPFRFRALDGGTSFLLMFGAIWLAAGTIITTAFTVSGGPLWNDLILDSRGAKADATPTAIEPTGSWINHRQVFRIVYRFADRSGSLVTGGGGTTDGELLARAERRERLSIDYDPAEPRLSRLSGGRASFFGWFTLFPMAFAVIGLVIFSKGLRRLLRFREIYKHGHAIEATVTGVSASNMRVNRRPVMRVDYAFDVITGRVTGRTTSLDPPAVGERIWVLYRPSEPTQNVAAY